MLRTMFLSLLLSLCGSFIANAEIELKTAGTFETGIFDESAAEIVAHDPESQRLFVINANEGVVDILRITSPNALKRATQKPGNTVLQINVSDDFANGGINSVDVKNGIVAVAVENEDSCLEGYIAFYDTDGNPLNELPGDINKIQVGVLPDAVKFSPDGNTLIVANEGEPCDTMDPPGSISIIDLSSGLASATVTTMGFAGVPIGPDVIIHPGKTPAEDLEPEFSAFSPDATQAFVTLQEANAFAIVDITTPEITEVVGLGFKDHSDNKPENGIDASDRDDAINIANWPVFGMYMPDGIASYSVGGQTYYVTANEGDARDEDERVKNLTLDPIAFPDAADLQEDENLGRLEVSTILGDTDNDGDYDELYAYGSRSFTIWDSNGNLVWDSADAFEQITAEANPDYFNSDNDENTFDTRSDAKGPEPENVAIGEIYGQHYAFVALERVGGIMVYNITNPIAPEFVQYINNRNFSVVDVEADLSEAGDLGPEGIIFIPAEDSPTAQPLVVVGNEVSGTTTAYRVKFSKKNKKK